MKSIAGQTLGEHNKKDAISKLLLIEDAGIDIFFVQRAVSKSEFLQSFSLHYAHTLAEGIALIQRDPPSLILLELNLPDCQGVESVKQIHQLQPLIPIVVLSGVNSNQVAIECLNEGAQEFLAKEDLNPFSLTRSVQFALTRSHIHQVEAGKARSREDNLNRISQIKSQFLANLSHEIRTPMNAILATASLLQQMSLTAEQLECVDIITNSSENLLNLMNDILDLSKIQAEKMQIASCKFQVRPLVESIVELFASHASAKNIHLLSRVDPSVPRFVNGDASRLKQILANLVSNALKFTERGYVEIEVYMGSQSMLTFQVKDTGLGIKKEDLKNIFSEFFQVHDERQKFLKGTGLGLSICKSLVELMHGHISCDSRYQEGSIFRVELPWIPSRSDDFVPRPDLSDKNLLILSEKGDIMVDMLRRQLGHRGLKTDVCFLEDPLGQWPQHDMILAYGADESQVSALQDIIGKQGVGEAQPPVLWLLPRFLGHQGDHVLKYPYRQSRLYEEVAALMGHDDSPQAVRALVGQVPQFPRSRHLLVAEDNPVNQEVAKLILQKLGLTCDIVPNGRLAVEMAKSHNYACILMDCWMPEMDGWEATHTLRALGYHQPIVAMTANAFQAERDACMEAGMSHYLSKPVTLESMQRLLEQVLVEGQGASEQREARPSRSVSEVAKVKRKVDRDR